MKPCLMWALVKNIKNAVVLYKKILNKLIKINCNTKDNNQTSF